jgi:hypothetical protein
MLFSSRRFPLSAESLVRPLQLAAFAILSVAVLSACGGSSAKKGDATLTPSPVGDVAGAASPTPEPPPVRIAPLTGEIIDEEQFAAISQRRPLAVMIDNIVEATPQVGLDQADVVIEALVEGGVTRYMAVFHSKQPEAIEPVRSVRTPFVKWAAEYDALLVHVGSAELDGPADAGQQIHDWGISDMDLGTQPFDYSYVRDKNREAPHNVLVSSTQLWQRAVELGLNAPPAFVTWPFTNPEGLMPGTAVTGFSVRFGSMSPRFAVQWDWDPGSLRYLRSQFGAPQADAVSNNRLAFANVIVEYADAYVADQNGHVLIDNVGEGPAQVFTNGQLIEGIWRKADIRARTEFLTADGAPIPLLAGPTWIEVVPPSSGASLD